jgi:hypothetical protein
MRKYWILFLGRVKAWLENKLQSENDRQFRAISKLVSANRLRSLQLQQKQCVHIAGCSPLSEGMDVLGRTAIVWHGLNSGEVIGICTVCQREFFPSDPDYAIWKKRASFNKFSAAGRWTKNLQAEPHLMRLVDLPTQIDMPRLSYKSVSDEVDPWLLNPDGSLDPFAAENVSFNIYRDEESEATNAPTA